MSDLTLTDMMRHSCAPGYHDALKALGDKTSGLAQQAWGLGRQVCAIDVAMRVPVPPAGISQQFETVVREWAGASDLADAGVAVFNDIHLGVQRIVSTGYRLGARAVAYQLAAPADRDEGTGRELDGFAQLFARSVEVFRASAEKAPDVLRPEVAALAARALETADETYFVVFGERPAGLAAAPAGPAGM